MSIQLGENCYGKQRVRVMQVTRHADRHDVKELTIGIRLEGEFETAHTKGDNSKVLPTDTMKNTVYALARKHRIETPEHFCLLLAEHFLANHAQVSSVRVEASETLWTRLLCAGKPHRHTFTRSSEEKRTAQVDGTRTDKIVQAGIDGLVVLKTTDSAFEGFLRDSFTTLKEDRDRILATVIRATWIYRPENSEFESIWHSVRQTMLGNIRRTRQ